MADLKQNVDIVCPIGDNSDDGRRSSLKFYGYKDGEYTSDDLPHRMAHVTARHEGTSADIKSRLTFITNTDASTFCTVDWYSGYGGSQGDSDINITGSYQGERTDNFILYLENNFSGVFGGSVVSHDSAFQYSVSPVNFGTAPIQSFTVWDGSAFVANEIFEGIIATWANSTFNVGVRYRILVNINKTTLESNGDFVSTGKVVSEGSTFVPKIVASDGSTLLNTYS
tara:strand:- start:1154 stop:1831 length:678 start_codon:yes stop_codon:yes gene_type:complete